MGKVEEGIQQQDRCQYKSLKQAEDTMEDALGELTHYKQYVFVSINLLYVF